MENAIPTAATASSRQIPIAWSILLALSAVRLGLYLFSNGRFPYGLMTDELYYLDCTNHLAWGYVDHPPFSIGLLWLVRATLGESILAVRLVPALAGCSVIVLSGVMAREMGGGRTAQGFAGLFTLSSPLLMGVTSTYTMNALEVVLWTAGAALVLRLTDSKRWEWWLGIGVVIGIGLLNKVSTAWFALGLGVGLLLTRERRWLVTPGPWLAGVLALALYSPNLVWQARNGWPMLEFLRHTAQVKQLTFTSPAEFLLAQLFVTGVPFWLLGLGFFFSPSGRPFRVLGWIWVSVFLLLLTSGAAKPYYMAPAYPLLLAAAGLPLERLRPRHGGLVRTAAAVATVVGLVFLPMTMSVVPPQRLASVLRDLGLTRYLTVDVTEASPLPQHFAQMFHGEAVVRAVARAYAQLSPEEQRRVVILTGHFGEAGAVNWYGPRLGLPAAIGTHVSYWFWGPGAATGDPAIVLSDSEAGLRESWSQVERVTEIDCRYCMPYLTRKAVYVVRNPRRSLREMWPEWKDYG